jgi:hypothetical protein
MPVVRSILKVHIYPRFGTASLQYQMTTRGLGPTDSIVITDTIELPDTITQVDLGLAYEPSNSRDMWGLTGAVINVSGGDNHWSVALGVDSQQRPALTVEHERTTPPLVEAAAVAPDGDTSPADDAGPPDVPGGASSGGDL